MLDIFVAVQRIKSIIDASLVVPGHVVCGIHIRWKLYRRLYAVVKIDVSLTLPFETALGGDHYHAVYGLSSVEDSCAGILQNRDGLYLGHTESADVTRKTVNDE